MAEILLLHDYRNQFYFSTSGYAVGMDVEKLRTELLTLGHTVTVMAIEDVDPRLDYTGQFVLYQSSEDRGLFYKRYIGGKIFALSLQGAQLVPDFRYFLAHEDKLFFEYLRISSGLPSLTNLWSATFSNFESLLKSDYRNWEYPVVVKTSHGSASRGVKLATSPAALLDIAKRFSLIMDPIGVAKEYGKRLLKSGYIPESIFRAPFMVQQYLPDLQKDYKVLVYGSRYFVLSRAVRAGDFRASGSGDFTYPDPPPVEVLSCARSAFLHFNVPFASFDVAVTATDCYILEGQFVRFGTYTLEHSRRYYTLEAGTWHAQDWTPRLEETLALAVSDFLAGGER